MFFSWKSTGTTKSINNSSIALFSLSAASSCDSKPASQQRSHSNEIKQLLVFRDYIMSKRQHKPPKLFTDNKFNMLLHLMPTLVN